eukprot:6158380-Amphidinium_carterae.1
MEPSTSHKLCHVEEANKFCFRISEEGGGGAGLNVKVSGNPEVDKASCSSTLAACGFLCGIVEKSSQSLDNDTVSWMQAKQEALQKLLALRDIQSKEERIKEWRALLRRYVLLKSSESGMP